MADYNPMIGGPAPIDDVPEGGAAVVPLNAEAVTEPRGTDRTEFMVAALLLGALAILVLMRVAGFQAVVATRVGIGGAS